MVAIVKPLSAATIYGWPLERERLRLPGGFKVLDPIEPGQSVVLPLAPRLTARADEAETDAAPYTNDEASVVVDDSGSFDLDVVEHTRQSRLQR